jgi:hypothetical protein
LLAIAAEPADKPDARLLALDPSKLGTLLSQSIWPGCPTWLLARSPAPFSILADEHGNQAKNILVLRFFEATDKDAAKKFMREDPAVAVGLTTAALRLFTVALQRWNP